MKSEKGITLTALVITIIILLILSSIAVYSGIGTVKYAGYNKAKSEIQMMQSNVNDWYQEYINVEVKEEEILEGQTEEQVKLTKQQAVIAKYGENIPNDSENSTKLTKTLNDVAEKGITLEGSEYKYLSKSYLEENLGLNASFEFLINIPSRTVLLFGGYSYDGTTYYTAEDFGIINVKSTEMSGITFNLAQGDNTDVIISDLKLSYGENNENEADLSKFIVQYKKTTDNSNNWSDATSSVVKFIDTSDNNKTKFKFPVPEKETATYNVKISTTDKGLTHTSSVYVRSPWVLATLDPGEGTVTTNSKLVKPGQTYGELPTPTREGYTFKGWNGKNMFDKNTGVEGYYIDDGNGNAVATSSSYATDFISIKPNQTYAISPRLSSGNWGAFYDENKTFISGFVYWSNNPTTPSNAKYMRFTISYSNSNNNWMNTTQLEEGSTATAYEPYYITSSTTVVQNTAHTLTAIWEENS